MDSKSTILATIKSDFRSFFKFLFQFRRLVYLLVFIFIMYFLYVKIIEKQESNTIEYNSALIEKQMKNVSKLIVTEGHYAEVITYKEQEKYLLDFVVFEKKALIVANATVLVTYDLRKITYSIDESAKTVKITNIPEPELKISQDLHFYDINHSRFNPFDADDYNKINKKVKAEMTKKIENSSLKENAKKQMQSELSKILILTNTMGWKLEF
jgi:hypothetical protein